MANIVVPNVAPKINTPLQSNLDPRVLPLTFDFSAGLVYSVDLEQQWSRKILDLVQCAYFDNLGNTTRVDFVWAVTNQRVSVPAAQQGYIPLLVPNPPRFTVTSNGGTGICTAFLLNVPMPLGLWTPGS